MIIIIALLTICTSLPGCSEDWWTRGQPPSVDTLINRSQGRLKAAISSRRSERGRAAELSANIEEALSSAIQAAKEGKNTVTVASLEKAKSAFVDIESQLSIGSRPAYAELSGELRRLVSVTTSGTAQAQAPAFRVVGLFVARTFFFLENELTMPQPAMPEPAMPQPVSS